MRGKLIVIDGNDGSGKHTQAELLCNELTRRDKKVFLIDFPGYTRNFFGRFLDEARNGAYGDFSKDNPYLASFPYALDRWHSRNKIKQTLKRGGYVVCDRYTTANAIHQGGKIADNLKRVAYLEWLEELEHTELQIPRPDIQVYLDVPVELSIRNMSDKLRDELEKNPEYLRNSHETAQWLVAQKPFLWLRVPCSHSGEMFPRDKIHADLVTALEKRGFI